MGFIAQGSRAQSAKSAEWPISIDTNCLAFSVIDKGGRYGIDSIPNNYSQQYLGITKY